MIEMNNSTDLTCWRCKANSLEVIKTIQDGNTTHVVLWCNGCEMPQQMQMNEHGVRKILLVPTEVNHV